MSKRVWKFAIPTSEDVADVAMPKGAKIIDAREQHGVACIWAVVDPGAELEMRQFMVVETGESRRGLADAVYIGSAHLRNGEYVVHIFESPAQAEG